MVKLFYPTRPCGHVWIKYNVSPSLPHKEMKTEIARKEIPSCPKHHVQKSLGSKCQLLASVPESPELNCLASIVASVCWYLASDSL